MKQLIFDGQVYDLVPVKQEPEFKPVIGQYYEFSDRPEFPRPMILKYEKKVIDSDYQFRAEGISWKYCRPIQDPNLIQMIPWEGGECPVPCDMKVLIKMRDGGDHISLAEDLRWDHADDEYDIVKYAVLK
jgi:hypothetical protein